MSTTRTLISHTDDLDVYETVDDQTGAVVSRESIAFTAEPGVEAFIRARFPMVLAKAKAIMADPASAPAFTAAETKVITAATVLDLARRFR